MSNIITDAKILYLINTIKVEGYFLKINTIVNYSDDVNGSKAGLK
jgi:hypothetical protein